MAFSGRKAGYVLSRVFPFHAPPAFQNYFHLGLDRFRKGTTFVPVKFVKTYISDKAGRKIEGEAAANKRSFKAQCAILLEQWADGLHPKLLHAKKKAI